MRGVGTLFAGMLVLVGLVALTVYIVHVSRVATQTIHEQQQLYERARFIAEHANISGNVISLPEPADIIIVDSQGIPHVAKNVAKLKLPWPADQSKVFVVKRGNLRVGAADPVASSIAAMASVASAPIEPNTGTEKAIRKVLATLYADKLIPTVRYSYDGLTWSTIALLGDVSKTGSAGTLQWRLIVITTENGTFAALAAANYTISVTPSGCRMQVASTLSPFYMIMQGDYITTTWLGSPCRLSATSLSSVTAALELRVPLLVLRDATSNIYVTAGGANVSSTGSGGFSDALSLPEAEICARVYPLAGYDPLSPGTPIAEQCWRGSAVITPDWVFSSLPQWVTTAVLEVAIYSSATSDMTLLHSWVDGVTGKQIYYYNATTAAFVFSISTVNAAGEFRVRNVYRTDGVCAPDCWRAYLTEIVSATLTNNILEEYMARGPEALIIS